MSNVLLSFFTPARPVLRRPCEASVPVHELFRTRACLAAFAKVTDCLSPYVTPITDTTTLITDFPFCRDRLSANP